MDEQRLASIPLFASLSRKERALVAQHADEIDFPEGRELVKEGAFSYELFAIEQGTAEVRQGDEHVADLGPGDVFGEMGVMSSGRRNATVATTSPMTAVVITASDFRAIAAQMPDVASRIRATIEERTRQAVAQ